MQCFLSMRRTMVQSANSSLRTVNILTFKHSSSLIPNCVVLVTKMAYLYNQNPIYNYPTLLSSFKSSQEPLEVKVSC
jgi:hypothetical protein